MKIDRRYFFYQLSLTLTATFCLIALYHFGVVRNISSEDEVRKQAKMVAEHEWVFSDQMNRIFRSSHPTDFISAAEASRKAVVFIKSIIRPDELLVQNYSNTGSGVLISSDGYIVTNQHVIHSASKVEVTLNDNRTYIAKLIGADKNTDLALLKIEVENADFLSFGNSDSLRIGEWVLAVGNPFRLQSSVTAGIVSAKARSINLLENQGIESFIQTDAAFNPGSSGGALVSTAGLLVGVSTAIMSESGRYEGFSFAIPANLARKVVADLKEFGTVQRGWLGVDIENIDNKMAEEMDLSEVSGVLISHVTKDGGAYEAGIRSNDVIISVNNIKIHNTSEFMEILGQYRPGEKLQIIYIRSKDKKTAFPILRNQLNTTDLIGIAADGAFHELGIEVRELDSYEKAIYTPGGVKVISITIGSIIANTKMEPDYIITKINNVKISGMAQFRKILEDFKGKSVILEGFYPKFPGEYPYTFVVP
ncbi:MAG: trypsin-like peptidase domain-containing protein [Saprospiraceae bacterium]|nr:trypsin-like peptidase domain-containing protein [Saprospiraceae bacterium]